MKHKIGKHKIKESDKEGIFSKRIGNRTFRVMTPMLALMNGFLGQKDILNIPMGALDRRIANTVLRLNALPYAETIGIPKIDSITIKGTGWLGKEFLDDVENVAKEFKVKVFRHGDVISLEIGGYSEQFWTALRETVITPRYEYEKGEIDSY